MPIAAAKIVNIIVFNRTFTKKIIFLLIFLLLIGKHRTPLHLCGRAQLRFLGHNLGTQNPQTDNTTAECQWVNLFSF